MSWPWLRTANATRQINAMTAAFADIDAQLAADKVGTVPASLGEANGGVPSPAGAVPSHYGIQDVSTGRWWVGGNRWSDKAAPARWFATWPEAELCGLRELHDPRSAWTVTIISEDQY